jgi:hypothetical protein
MFSRVAARDQQHRAKTQQPSRRSAHLRGGAAIGIEEELPGLTGKSHWHWKTAMTKATAWAKRKARSEKVPRADILRSTPKRAVLVFLDELQKNRGAVTARKDNPLGIIARSTDVF